MARTFSVDTSDLMAADAAAGFSEQNPYSVAFWINAPTPVAAANCYTEGRSTTTNPFLQIGCGATNRSRVTMSIRNDAGGGAQVNAVLSASTLFDSTWRHFGFAQDGAATCAYATYFNGVLDATLKGTYSSGVTTINRLGLACARLTSNTKFMTCSMAHVAIWHRQLSAAEFASLAAGLLPSHLAPAHYWPLWGADSPEPDIGTSAHTSGTLTGSSQTAGGPPTSIYLVGRGWSGIHKPGFATVTGAATLTGAGALTAAGIRTVFGAASLTGTGSLTGSGFQTATGQASLTGQGFLTAAGGSQIFGAVSMTGLGSLTAAGAIVRYGAAALAGLGSLAATGTVTGPPHVIEGTIGVGYIDFPDSGYTQRPGTGRIVPPTTGSIG